MPFDLDEHLETNLTNIDDLPSNSYAGITHPNCQVSQNQ